MTNDKRTVEEIAEEVVRKEDSFPHHHPHRVKVVADALTAERRRAEEADKFCEIFKKSQIEFEKRIEDLECRLDVALKSAEQWRKEALRLNNVEPPSITVPHDNLTREMRFNLCLKMIDQMNQVELDNLIRELNKK